MEKNQGQTPDTKQESFIDKAKNALSKFFTGAKNFFIKTGRVNSSNCYGIIDNIGDFLVYDDHALISAVGMDDIVFTSKNVLSFSFEGLGKIRRNKATVKYLINLDNNVVFPEKVREKNDVNNLIAIINIEKEKSHFLGSGLIGSDETKKMYFDNCDIYGYDDCLIIVYKLEKKVGETTEKYQESVLYPFDNIVEVVQKEDMDKTLNVRFNDGKIAVFTAVNTTAFEKVMAIK